MTFAGGVALCQVLHSLYLSGRRTQWVRLPSSELHFELSVSELVQITSATIIAHFTQRCLLWTRLPQECNQFCFVPILLVCLFVFFALQINKGRCLHIFRRRCQIVLPHRYKQICKLQQRSDLIPEALRAFQTDASSCCLPCVSVTYWLFSFFALKSSSNLFPRCQVVSSVGAFFFLCAF